MPICKVKNKQEIYVDACIPVCSGNLFQMANTYCECQRFCTSWKCLCKNGKRNDCPSALCSGKHDAGRMHNMWEAQEPGERGGEATFSFITLKPWETHWVMWWQHAQMRIHSAFPLETSWAEKLSCEFSKRAQPSDGPRRVLWALFYLFFLKCRC